MDRSEIEAWGVIVGGRGLLRRTAAVVTLCAHTLAVSSTAWGQTAAASPPEEEGVDLEEEAAEVAPEQAAAEGGATEVDAKADTGAAGKAVVRIESEGSDVTVATVLDRTVASGYGVAIAGIRWKDLCVTPCEVQLDPGMHELMVYGSGVTAAAEKYQLQAGQHRVVVDPGSSALHTGGVWLTALGTVAAVTGTLFLFLFTETTEYDCDVDPSCPERTEDSATKKLALPLLLGGAAGIGGGIGMMLAGSTSLEKQSQTANLSQLDPRSVPLGLNYRRSF